MKNLIAHTTLKIEALLYNEAMFEDYVSGSIRGGWNLVLSRDYDGIVSSSDILKFIEDVKDAMKNREGYVFTDFDSAHVAASLFTRYRCTIDKIGLGFIVKTKTSIKVSDSKEKGINGFFLFRFFKLCFSCFKRTYNGFLDFIKIG